MAHHPPQFQETLATLKAHNDYRPDQFARAGARRRLARSLAGISLHGVTALLEAVYAQLLKLALSYLAREELTTSPKKSAPPIFSEELSQTLSSPEIGVFRGPVSLYAKNLLLKQRLFAPADGSHAKLGVPFAAIRPVAHHGQLTIFGAGLRRATRRKFLENLTSTRARGL